MALREEIKTVEFAAEKLQQEALESLVSVDQARDVVPGQVIADVTGNLSLYLEHLDIGIDKDVREKLSVIVRAAFPEFDEKDHASAFAS